MPHPQTPPCRGEIYWVDLNPSRGSEQAGHRPAVIISVDSFNKVMPIVVVAAITSQIKPYAFTVDLPAGKPLPRRSQIQAFQVTTFDKTRLGNYLGILDDAQLDSLKVAMKLAWGL